MVQMDIQKLIEVYRRYGFQLARNQAKEEILVFTLKNGYFDNAEIVKLTNQSNSDSLFDEFTRAGYACTIRVAKSPEQAESELFEGFFSVDATRERLLDDYRRFSKNLVAAYETGTAYQYIKAPYQINGRAGLLSPPEEVLQLMNEKGPVLFLIEAAAGFGKTCTALEIVKLLADNNRHLPLYAELSRNRQARIFRYILLDEIDRSFPSLSSRLVQTEIKNGRIATILDGFDELLRKNEDTGTFENKEPMLETVSELLTGRAKIIITTRRTVLFDGDEFHQWLEKHANDFKIVRIRIQEPRVVDWLDAGRLGKLQGAGIDIEKMANPVLLSHLRCISSLKFAEAVEDPDSIVDSYFSYMLDRERERQDLRMNIETQSAILTSIAGDMVEGGYTAEERDNIIAFIILNQHRALDQTRAQYPVSEKPSREEIANKLASHALLDRSSQDPNKISFINEFALGHYVAQNILASSAWLNDDMRFLEPAVRAYQPRGVEVRSDLFAKLTESLEYVDISSKIEISIDLIGAIPFELRDGEAENIEFTSIYISEYPISDFQFNECVFKRCRFNVEKMTSVTFLNCRFYDCSVENFESPGPVFVLGGSSEPDLSASLGGNRNENTQVQLNRADEIDRFILRRLWPTGEDYAQPPSRPIYRPVKILCYPTDIYNASQLYESLQRLKKLGLLTEMNKSGLIKINSDEFVRVQALLGGQT